MWQWLTPRRAQVLFWLALLSISMLAFMPGPEVPVSTRWDKGDHTLAFFVLSVLAMLSWPRQPWWRLALWLIGYGVLIEIVQAFLPSREASLLDLLADSTGIALHGVFYVFMARRFSAPA
ncbi:MAG: VanZ family protein [Spongiibacteraceae bacterium]